MEANNEKTVLALKEASTEIANFVGSVTAEVEALEKQFGGIVPTAETKEDYEFCKSVRKDVQPIKVRMEEARKTLKAPVLEMGKKIDVSLKPLIDRLESLYKPFVDCYQEVDNRKKRLEEERQQKIQDAFSRMTDAAMEAIGQTSTIIESIIDDLADFDFDPDVFQERTEEAVKQHGELMQKLEGMKKAQEAAEDLQRRQEEIERKEREQREAEEAERQRIEREKIAQEAAEKARIEAEERHKRELEEAERRRIREAEQAKQREIEAEQRAKEQAEAAANAERQRIEAEQKAKEEEERKREADRKHKGKIHSEIVKNLTDAGLTESDAKKAVELIAKGLAGNVRIYY